MHDSLSRKLSIPFPAKWPRGFLTCFFATSVWFLIFLTKSVIYLDDPFVDTVGCIGWWDHRITIAWTQQTYWCFMSPLSFSHQKPMRETMTLPKPPTKEIAWSTWMVPPIRVEIVYTPQKIWNLKMMVSKRNLLFQGLLFRFHVKFQGCSQVNLPPPKCA